MVGRVQHHALACPQGQHRFADRLRVGALAAGRIQRGDQLAVAQRCAAARRIQRKLHLQDHGGHRKPISVFEHARAIAEAQVARGYPTHLTRAPIQKPNPSDGVRHLRAIRPHVLHGCRPGRSWDARQAFQSAQTLFDGPNHHVIEDRTGLGPHQVTVDGDAAIGQPHHGQVGQVLGDHQIGATSKHQRAVSSGLGRRIQVPQRSHHLFGADASDDTSGDRAHTQSGQRRQRDRLGNMRTGKERTDTAPFHGP